MPTNTIRGFLLKTALVTGSCTLTLAVAELLGRTVARPLIEVAGQQEAWPIFYRLPDQPTGAIFFHRAGPATWSGRVLHEGLKLTCGSGDYYTNERPITVSYDTDGFRNPADLRDWEVVVVGDSCVELGCLAYADLFTSQFGQQTGTRVKNLGAAGAAPLTYLHYLVRFGRAPSTRHAFMVFFEGNDIEELECEQRELDRWAATGRRAYRWTAASGSLLGLAKWKAVNLGQGLRARQALRECAWFESVQGPVAVTPDYLPPGSEQLTVPARKLLDTAVARWGETARQEGLLPWVLYMPCKRRVLAGAMRLSPRAAPRDTAWRPGDLPAFMSELCRSHGVEFVDPTPALVEETRRGNLTFNPLWDTHLNRLGATVVAQLMAARYAKISSKCPKMPATVNPQPSRD